MMNKDASLGMSGNALQDAIEHGADVVATGCPLCHLSLDSYQPEIELLQKKKPIHSHPALTTTGGSGIGLHTHTTGNGHPHRLHPQNKPDPFWLAFSFSLTGEQ